MGSACIPSDFPGGSQFVFSGIVFLFQVMRDYLDNPTGLDTVRESNTSFEQQKEFAA